MATTSAYVPTCEHEEAFIISDSDIIKRFLDYGQSFYYCKACGVINGAGEVLPYDPTKSRLCSAPAKAESPASETPEASAEAETPVPKVLGKVRLAPMLKGRIEDSGEHLAQEPVPTALRLDPNAQVPRASSELSPADMIHVGVLPGPWEGMRCPNRTNKTEACEGRMKAFHTLHSPSAGNTYMYRCDDCGANASACFKRARIKQ